MGARFGLDWFGSRPLALVFFRFKLGWRSPILERLERARVWLEASSPWHAWRPASGLGYLLLPQPSPACGIGCSAASRRAFGSGPPFRPAQWPRAHSVQGGVSPYCMQEPFKQVLAIPTYKQGDDTVEAGRPRYVDPGIASVCTETRKPPPTYYGTQHRPSQKIDSQQNLKP